MIDMEFSVVIPVFNVEKYLKQCVRSVIDQNRDDIEIILVDDGSKDDSGEICDDFASEFSFIHVIHKVNEGLLRARRDGFKLTQGDYVLSLDSDDYFFDGAFDKLRDIIKSESPDVIFFDLTKVKNGENIGKLNKALPYKNNSFIRKDDIYETILLKKYNIVSMAAKCVKRSCIDIDNTYTQFSGQNYGEDSLQSIAIYSRAKTVYHTDYDIYAYRLGSGMTKNTSVDYFFGMKNVYYTLLPCEKTWNVPEFREKTKIFLLKSAVEYVLIQYKSDYDRQDLIESFGKIRNDSEFNECFSSIKVDVYKSALSFVERTILRCLRGENFNTLFLMVSLLRILRICGFFNR